MQAKTTLRFHLNLVSTVKINETSNNSQWQGGQWACKLVQPLRKLVWWFPRKMGIIVHQDSATPIFLGTFSSVCFVHFQFVSLCFTLL